MGLYDNSGFGIQLKFFAELEIMVLQVATHYKTKVAVACQKSLYFLCGSFQQTTGLLYSKDSFFFEKLQQTF